MRANSEQKTHGRSNCQQVHDNDLTLVTLRSPKRSSIPRNFPGQKAIFHRHGAVPGRRSIQSNR